VFRITARTVLELGAELISSDIIAFYELIKNGFDAGSKRGVELRFDIALPRHAYLKLQGAISKGGALTEHRKAIEDAILPGASEAAKAALLSAISSPQTPSQLSAALAAAQAKINTISVADTGSGMSLDDLQKNFLVIGTASRKREVDAALAAGAKESPYLGEKGIGRLSAMRLGEGLRVETARESDERLNLLEIDWRAFGDIDAMLDEVPVAPAVGGLKPTKVWSGTSIIVSDLLENWTEPRVREMCEDDFARLTDPFADPATRPRVAIFWNGERLNVPMMPQRLLDAAHARVTGRYEVIDGKPLMTCTVDVINLDFDHPPETETVTLDAEDLEGAIVGKDRQIEDGALISVGPFSFEAHWFNRRRLSKVDSTGENKAIRDLQTQWAGILLFRDRFRVFPYGENDDDWLELDRRALGRKGYLLNKSQLIGRVSISRAMNRSLIDQTNREGLRVTPEQQVLLEVVRYAVQDRLGAFMRDVERQYKGQKIDLSDAKNRVSGLEDRARNAIRKLRRLTPKEGDDAIDELQQTLLEFSDFAAKARARIEEVEKESRQMIEMAGVGLMVEVVAHELARASENALKALDKLKGSEVPDRLRAHFNTLKAEMKSISKRVRILDPLSVSGRQRVEPFALDTLLRESIEAHEAQFARHNVKVVLELPKRPLHVRAVKGMIVQIIENLISNSIHWMEFRLEREPSYKPLITITLQDGPPTISFEDNGRGISAANREKVFKPFFSLKESKRRRGLGLFIAREAAQHHGGTLTLDDEVNPDTKRLHRFVLELPLSTQA